MALFFADRGIPSKARPVTSPIRKTRRPRARRRSWRKRTRRGSCRCRRPSSARSTGPIDRLGPSYTSFDARPGSHGAIRSLARLLHQLLTLYAPRRDRTMRNHLVSCQAATGREIGVEVAYVVGFSGGAKPSCPERGRPLRWAQQPTVASNGCSQRPLLMINGVRRWSDRGGLAATRPTPAASLISPRFRPHHSRSGFLRKIRGGWGRLTGPGVLLSSRAVEHR